MVKTGFLRKVRSFKRRACGFALSLVLAVGMLPVFNSAPVKADDSNGEKIYNDILNMGNVDPECLKNTSNPYGYAYDEPFYMYRPQNLVQFYNYDGGNATYATYNFKGKANNTDFIYKGLSAVNKIGDNQKMNYVRIVAFDPKGDGRKNWLACTGVKSYGEGNNTLFFWCIDENGNRSDYLELGKMNWMGDTSSSGCNSQYYNSGSFISITAGDYNKDSKDTVVVYGCFDGNGFGCREIKVVDVSKRTCTVGGVYQHLLNEAYTNNWTIKDYINKKNDKKEYVNNDTIENKLSLALTTGDVNNDGIDDLIAVSSPCRLEQKDQEWQNYAGCVKVSIGSKGRESDITADWSACAYIDIPYDYKNHHYHISCVAPGVSVGDLDGDGKNEIIAAGIKNTIDPSGNKFDVDGNKIIIATYEFVSNYNMTTKDIKELNTNPWTYGGFYSSDNAWQPIAVQCVAFEGKVAADKVFINGTIYKWIPKTNSTSGGITEDTILDYFTQDDDWSDSVSVSIFDLGVYQIISPSSLYMGV